MILKKAWPVPDLPANLFSWIFPVLIFIGFWYFLMKRFQQQQGGFMSLGKNKAKIYMENDVQAKFDDAAGVDEAKQELVEVIDFSPSWVTLFGTGWPEPTRPNKSWSRSSTF